MRLDDTPISPTERALLDRIEELSPHHRALVGVLRFWSAFAAPASILGALAAAAVFAFTGPGRVSSGLFLLIYAGVAVPGALAAFVGQRKLREAIARRLLARLDAPVRGAISGGESSAGFGAAREDDRTR